MEIVNSVTTKRITDGILYMMENLRFLFIIICTYKVVVIDKKKVCLFC